MISTLLRKLGFMLALITIGSCHLMGQAGAALTQDEEDKIRETQDPGERIVVYLDLLQDRLMRFDSFRRRPVDPKYDNARYLDDQMGEYIALVEEMKNWIEYHYEHMGDMRGGLRTLLERGAQQLTTLHAIRDSPDPYARQYEDSLRDAIDQLADTLDGATKALADQTAKLKDLKRQGKEEERLAKERRKEEAKRAKEEKKLRKSQGKKGRAPGETDEE